MPSHTDIIRSPYSVQQLFDLVKDVEHYPEFLPWCRAARVLKHEAHGFQAELVICFKQLCERYTSRVLPQPQPSVHESATIRVELVSGPFDHLDNYWEFLPMANGGTEIRFKVDFAFRSRILNTLIGGLFSRAVEKLAHAFTERADALYGKLTPNA